MDQIVPVWRRRQGKRSVGCLAAIWTDHLRRPAVIGCGRQSTDSVGSRRGLCPPVDGYKLIYLKLLLIILNVQRIDTIGFEQAPLPNRSTTLP